MSDPVTNIDIEDVLASIRRLVLTGGPPGAAVMGAGPTPARSRLVLTQAQRVGEAGEPDADPEPMARAPLLVLSAPLARPEPEPLREPLREHRQAKNAKTRYFRFASNSL